MSQITKAKSPRQIIKRTAFKDGLTAARFIDRADRQEFLTLSAPGSGAFIVLLSLMIKSRIRFGRVFYFLRTQIQAF